MSPAARKGKGNPGDAQRGSGKVTTSPVAAERYAASSTSVACAASATDSSLSLPASRRSRKYDASLAVAVKGSHVFFGRTWTASCVLCQKPIGSSGLTFGGTHGGS